MITQWLIFISEQPEIYQSSEYDVSLQGDVVVINGETIVTLDRYAEEAWELATSAPPLDPDDTEWMPLGVFALVPNDLVSEPTLFLQLNISREGVISGTYENIVSGQIHPIEGQVDRRGLRAAWTFSTSDNPVFDTGLANLSEESTNVLLHFDSGRTQEWVLVRLEDGG